MRIAGFLCGCVLASCASAPRADDEARDDLRTLAVWMTGSFSSAEQAEAAPERYRDVRLHMTPIWSGAVKRGDVAWLYVEQAMAATPERPYRQRVYRLSRGGDGESLELGVFELPGDPLRFAGAWREPRMLDRVVPAMLTPREGCTITLRRDGDCFVGSTEGQGCPSTWHGAVHAMSEVWIAEDRLISWDRGFDSEGIQRWGAEEGGYKFIKDPTGD